MKLFEVNVMDLKNEDNAHGFQGHVKLNVPNYKERIALLQELGINENSGLEAGTKMIELVEKQVESVELLHLSGDKFNSLDDLSYSAEGTLLMNAIGAMIINGIPLGNGLKSH